MICGKGRDFAAGSTESLYFSISGMAGAGLETRSRHGDPVRRGCGERPNETRIPQEMDWQGLKPDSFC
jgi:hypothetical protein